MSKTKFLTHLLSPLLNLSLSQEVKALGSCYPTTEAVCILFITLVHHPRKQDGLTGNTQSLSPSHQPCHHALRLQRPHLQSTQLHLLPVSWPSSHILSLGLGSVHPSIAHPVPCSGLCSNCSLERPCLTMGKSLVSVISYLLN